MFVASGCSTGRPLEAETTAELLTAAGRRRPGLSALSAACVGSSGAAGSLYCSEMAGCASCRIAASLAHVLGHALANGGVMQNSSISVLRLWLVMHWLLGRWFIVFQGNGVSCRIAASLAPVVGYALATGALVHCISGKWRGVRHAELQHLLRLWLVVHSLLGRWVTGLQGNGGVYIHI